MIDRVVEKLGRQLYEVQWDSSGLYPGLIEGSVCFGGEESAGASFLRRNGTVWTTDKDGPIWIFLPQRSPLERERIPECTTVN